MVQIIRHLDAKPTTLLQDSNKKITFCINSNLKGKDILTIVKDKHNGFIMIRESDFTCTFRIYMIKFNDSDSDSNTGTVNPKGNTNFNPEIQFSTTTTTNILEETIKIVTSDMLCNINNRTHNTYFLHKEDIEYVKNKLELKTLHSSDIDTRNFYYICNEDNMYIFHVNKQTITVGINRFPDCMFELYHREENVYKKDYEKLISDYGELFGYRYKSANSVKN